MKIERKKLILIIAVIAAVVLTGLVILLSVLTGGKESDDSDTPNQTVAPSDDATNGVSQEPQVEIGNPDDPEAPPADAYQNDYSNDTGYDKLPSGFDGSSAPQGTVFDAQWAYARYYDITCDLGNKQTVTEEALQPMEDFYDDLALVGDPSSDSMRATIKRYLDKYEPLIGERSPGDTRQELLLTCDIEDVE